MELFIVLFVTLIIIVPIIVVYFLDKTRPLTEGEKIYKEVVEKLKHEDEEKVKNYLKRQYNLSLFTASSLVSAAKKGLSEYFEMIFNDSKRA